MTFPAVFAIDLRAVLHNIPAMDQEPINVSLPYALLLLSILIGGIPVAIHVLARHKTHPPDRQRCTETIAARSWQAGPVFLLMAFAVLLNLVVSIIALRLGEEHRSVVSIFGTAVIQLVLVLAMHHLIRPTGSWSRHFGMGRDNLRLLKLSPVLYLAMMPGIWVATVIFQTLLELLFGMEITMQDVALDIAGQTSWAAVGYFLLVTIGALWSRRRCSEESSFRSWSNALD